MYRDISWDFGPKFNFNIFSWKLVSLSNYISLDFWEKILDIFGRTSNGAGLLEKTEIGVLWSTVAGDKEVVWLQKTNRGFHTRRISFLGNLRPFSFSYHRKTSFLRKILTFYSFSSVFKKNFLTFVSIILKIII